MTIQLPDAAVTWWPASDRLRIATRFDPTGSPRHSGRVEVRPDGFAAFDASGRPIGRYADEGTARRAVAAGAPIRG